MGDKQIWDGIGVRVVAIPQNSKTNVGQGQTGEFMS